MSPGETAAASLHSLLEVFLSVPLPSTSAVSQSVGAAEVDVLEEKRGRIGCVEGVFVPGSLERFVFTAGGIPFISIITKPSALKKKKAGGLSEPAVSPRSSFSEAEEEEKQSVLSLPN